MARKYRRPPVASDKRFKRIRADSGPPERWQHSNRSVEFTEDAGVFAARSCQEHILDRLVLLGLITEDGREAGLKLHRDYNIARVEEAVSMSFSPVRVRSGDPQRRLERSEAEEAAYRRWRLALKPLSSLSRDVVIHVACVGCCPALEQLGKLKQGLGRLATYYEKGF
jgi:hypothetical protein